MKLLFTGASGFLGNNVYPLLQRMYEIHTVGLSTEDDYTANLAQEVPDLHEEYEVVLHAAGKAHVVPKTELTEKAFDINYQGTVHLCRALEKAGFRKHLFLFQRLPYMDVNTVKILQKNIR